MKSFTNDFKLQRATDIDPFYSNFSEYLFLIYFSVLLTRELVYFL